jgi:uncharacterized protein DUF3857/transglutaminase superfamily protein
MRRSANLLTAFLVGVALFGASRAQAGIPDWMRAAGNQKLPTYPDDAPAVLLLDEMVTTVKDSGEIDTVYRRVYKILRTEGRDFGRVIVYFDTDTRLTYLKGWSVTQEGQEYEVKEKEAVEVTPFFGMLFRDTHLKALLLPAAEPGSLIGYEYEQRRRPYVLQDSWLFQEKIPVRLSRYALNLPKGWEIHPHWRNHSPAEPRTAGPENWLWEMEDVPAVEEETDMPSWRAVAGRMSISFFAPDASHQAPALNSWADVGRWYASLAADRRRATPDIHQKALELTAKSATWLDKVRSLASYVQGNIRYVAIEVGIGGYQPHAAGDIFANKYGDCKDKVTLLSTMLGEIGVKSYYVLVNSERGVVARDVPSALVFDHVIVAIPLPAEAAAAELHAVVPMEGLGNLLLFDPTDPHTPLGTLPPQEQASQVLLVDDKGGTILTTPLAPPSDNNLLREGKLNLAADGTLSGEITELRRGAVAIQLKALLKSTNGEERAKVLENYLAGSLSGFSMQNPRADDLDAPGDLLTLHYSLSAEGYAQPVGHLILVRPRVLGVKSENVLEDKPRKYGLEFPYASVQGDSYEITLPPGFLVDELPAALEVKAPSFSYRSQSEVAKNVLSYRRVYERKEVDFPLSQLEELKKFFRQVSADERSLAVLKQSVSPPH